ncbi:hypothetical protein Acr_25g0000990 [Actinidia rufa]|uniref:Uncharacterized protein n=1 Tax=Actinidia rufa TaxID=165716 RepID=A0A7J0GXY8_9ERIC|nr:hypothetical protein Acr_25g0000990 [Actinidia rufa]
MSSSKKPGSKLLALPCPPSPALEIVNRYQVLGTIPKPSYTSVLASSQSSIAPMADPLQTVKLEFPVLVPAPVKQVPQAPASSVKQVPAALAVPKSSYSTVNLDSPSSSSKPSKTKSSKSKSKTPEFIQDNTELLRVANLLLAQVQAQAQSAIKEESASSNDSTAQSAQSESPDPYGLQDAQDPFA